MKRPNSPVRVNNIFAIETGISELKKIRFFVVVVGIKHIKDTRLYMASY